MANNTLTALAPSAFAALNEISRELVGLVPSVALNSNGTQRVAIGNTVNIPVVGTANISDVTPGMTVPDTTGQTVTTVQISITKSRAAEFGFVGEEQLALNNGGTFDTVQRDMIAQAMRGLVNEMESDLASQYITASRAYGTAATTPFASGISELAQVHKILVDNGAPTTNKQIVLDTTSGANLRGNTSLTNVNQAGTAETLRDGIFGRLQGFAVRESGQLSTHTGGTATDVTVTGVNAIGVTAIGVTTGASGDVALTAGDIITFAGDTNKYVVAADVTIGTSTTGTITIGANGLREATAGAEAITVLADYAVNMAFDKNAIQLAVRAPALPDGGDTAEDRMMITDPISGLGFELAVYKGYRKVRFEVALAWGYKVIKPEHTALLIG